MMATPWIFLVLVFARVHALPEGMLQQTRADACPAPDFAFCDFVVCENGQCKPDKNSTECFKCECDAGFTGTLCEMPITTPLGCNPGCLNGGICHQTGPSTFACVCPPEFSGNQCEMSAMASHPCLTMPTVVCQNGGTCAVMGAGFLCNCAPGWNGTNCEIAEAVTQCNPNPCGAHGSCIAVNAPSGPLAFCSCENRWSGRFCDYNLDGPCVPGYCQSGGTCTPLNNLPICQCPPTHTGQRCETTLPTMGTTMTTWTTSTAPAITPTMTTTTTTTRPTLVLLPGDCSTSPCQNGAQCFTVGNQFACVCAAQWSGPTCTMFDFTTVTSTSTTTTSTSTTTTTRPTLVLLPGDCSTSPCQNGAQCFTIGNQFACVCAAQWSGPTCTMLDSTTVTSTSTTTTTSTTLAPGTDACTPNPCSNGGSCYKHAGSFVCTCTSAFTGPTCALPKTTTTPPVTTGAPVVNCASKPCRNGGTCFDTGNSYFCHCGSSTNFTGRQCETPVSMLATDCPLNCTPGYCVRTGSSAQNNAYACMCNGVLTPTSCS